MRRECLRRGPAGLANVTVKEENPQLSFPLLALALPLCEGWTACQVRTIKYSLLSEKTPQKLFFFFCIHPFISEKF